MKEEFNEKIFYPINYLETKKDVVIYIDSEKEYDNLKLLTKKLCNQYYGKKCYSLFRRTYSVSSHKNNPGEYEESIIITVDQIIEYKDKFLVNNGWRVGPLDREDAMRLISHMNATTISTTKFNNYFYYDSKNDFNRYTFGISGPPVYYFSNSKLKEVELNQILKTEIKNDKRTEINTEYGREKGGTAISSNSTRKVANASRLIGNAISNSVKTTRVGRFEISRNAISC